jgi:hypothetical protein
VRIVYPELAIADKADHDAGTEYYPDSDGIELFDPQLIRGIGVTAEDVSISVEVSLDRVTWYDVTGYILDVDSWWLGSPVVVAAGAAVSMLWQLILVQADYLRIKAVYGDATNELSVTLGRRTA